MSETRSDARALMMYDAGKKSTLVAYLFWFFLGGLGAHRFYAGRKLSGFVMLGLLATSIVLSVIGIGFVGLFVIGCWMLVDAFLIPGMLRKHNAALIATLG